MSHCLSLPPGRKRKVTSERINATTEAGGGASIRSLRSQNRQEKKMKKAEDARAQPEETGLDNRGDEAGQVDAGAATSTAETSAHTTTGPDTFRRILSEQEADMARAWI